MLADAIRAETWRLSKNRTALFWSVIFLPVFGLLMATVGNLFLNANEAKLTVNGKAPPQVTEMLLGGPINLAAETLESASALADPVILFFLLIGAAAIYAGDYRWETWRLISARNSRDNLQLGKLGTFGLLALAAMAALLIGATVETVVKGAILGRPLTFSLADGDVGRFFAYFGLSWLSILQFTMVALLAAVVTRSLLATLIVPLVVGVAQFFSPQTLAPMGVEPDGWIAVLVNPGQAVGYIKAAIAGGPAAAALPDGALIKGWVSLGLNTTLPLIAALALFRRQDLSKE